MAYQITWKEKNVFVQIKGVITFEDLMEMNNKIYGDARFDSLNCQIVDYREIDQANISNDEIEIISSLEKASSYWNKNIKIANIASASKTIELIEFYSEMLKGSGWQFAIFTSKEEALEWCKSI